MKLLFVHEVSYRKKVIFEMHEFPELLALNGHEVSFLEFDEGRKFWERGLAPGQEVIQGRVHSRAAINLYRPFQLGIPGLDRLLAILTVMPRLRKLFRESAFDAVILYAVPTYGLQTLWFAKKYQVPVMFRALDVSHKIRATLFSPAIKAIEKWIYKHADGLSVHNPAMEEYCCRLGNRTKGTKTHYPPLDLSHFSVLRTESSLRQSLGFTDEDRVLIYMGSFFHFSGLKNALRQFAETSELRTKSKLLLVGGGEEERLLRKLTYRLHLEDRVVFTGFVGYRELPSYLRVADVALNTLEASIVTDLALPHKVLQYMAAGLPVVSTRLRGLAKTFGKNSGISWANDSRQVVRVATELVQSSDETLLKISQTQLAAVSKIFDVESAVAEFEKSLIKLRQGFK